MEGKEKVHGAPLEGRFVFMTCHLVMFHTKLSINIISTEDDIKQLKKKWGFNPEKKFDVSSDVSITLI